MCISSIVFFVSYLELGYVNLEYFFLLLPPFLSICVFWFLGVYSTVLRFIDISSLYLLCKSTIISFFIYFSSAYLFHLLETGSSFSLLSPILSLTSWSMIFFCSFFVVIVIRIIANYYLAENYKGKRVAIYGAGEAGIQLANALRVSQELVPSVFIDKNPLIQNTYISGIKVLAPSELSKLINRRKIDEVLLAMPSSSRSTLRNLLKEIEKDSIKVRILPGLSDLAQGKVLVSELKEVEINDLLGRYEVVADEKLLNRNVRDKVVLITGAGGSIGSEVSKRVSLLKPRKLLILDSNEYALYKIKSEIQEFSPKVKLYSLIGNVTDKKGIQKICDSFGVNTIYHSAAYKHVPLVEENVFAGVRNNIFGTKSCLEAAIQSKVETFVLISTDKAVNPTNIMGATKRFAELILQAYSKNNETRMNTRMTMVRFGNVLGSSGSAVPLFQKQISEGGPITVTHPEVIRYFMSIPEAAELVVQAGAMGEGGDVFVLDMGEPVKIIELAEKLIKLNGLQLRNNDNPEGDIEIIFTGLRPGEKLYEELLIGNNVSNTEHKQIMRAEEVSISKEELDLSLSKIRLAERENDVATLKSIFQEIINGFSDEETIVDIMSLQNNNL